MKKCVICLITSRLNAMGMGIVKGILLKSLCVTCTRGTVGRRVDWTPNVAKPNGTRLKSKTTMAFVGFGMSMLHFVQRAHFKNTTLK